MEASENETLFLGLRGLQQTEGTVFCVNWVEQETKDLRGMLVIMVWVWVTERVEDIMMMIDVDSRSLFFL